MTNSSSTRHVSVILVRYDASMVTGGTEENAPPRLPAWKLGWVFLRLGATAFGGLGAALALIERELVERRQVLTREEMTEALTYTKLLPGSTVVQVVAYVGLRLGGWPGSALATIAFILPSALAMLMLAVAYDAVSDLPNLSSVINALTAAVVGLLLATTLKLGKANVKGAFTLLLALAAFAAALLLDVSAAWIVVAAGTIGVLFLRRPAVAQASRKEGAA